jgi:hypothetical protein
MNEDRGVVLTTDVAQEVLKRLTFHFIKQCKKRGTEDTNIILSALNMGREALVYLEAQQADSWIPVTERLPEESGYYAVTAKQYHIEPFTEWFFYEKDRLTWSIVADGHDEDNTSWQEVFKGEVIAWKKENPYKPPQ